VRSSVPFGFVRVIGVLTLLLAGLSFSVAQAQTKTELGSISGTVTDQTQAVVADAKAVLTNTAGEKVEAQSMTRACIRSPGLNRGLTT